MAHPVMRSITDEELEWIGYRPQKEDIHEHSWLYRRNKARVIFDKRRLEMNGVKVDIPSGRTA
jgi:hypothetical protein